MQWTDGRSYRGQFLDSLFDGYGVLTVRAGGAGAGGTVRAGGGAGVGEEGTAEVSEGFWKAGQLHGPGVIRFASFFHIFFEVDKYTINLHVVFIIRSGNCRFPAEE